MNKIHSLANAPTTIITNKNEEILFEMGANDLDIFTNLVLMYRPNKTGRVEITNIVRPSKKILIGGALFPIKYVTEKPTIRGKVITVNRLATAVQDIDNAVSPFANLVRIFEVTPPGQQDKIIIPTARLLGRLNIITIKKAIIGKTII
tara:strand:+ start:711 stop:1154 length:444 start_codon:yes stop_codon:yes gene_type:complete